MPLYKRGVKPCFALLTPPEVLQIQQPTPDENDCAFALDGRFMRSLRTLNSLFMSFQV